MPVIVPVITNPELAQRIRKENTIVAFILIETLAVIVLASYAGFVILHEPWPQGFFLVFGAVFMDWGIIGALLGYRERKVSPAYIIELVLLAFGLFFLIIVGKPVAVFILAGSLVAGIVDWKTNRQRWDKWNYVILGLAVLITLLAGYTSGAWAL